MRLVILAGTRFVIDAHLAKNGQASHFYKKNRITDASALKAAMHAACEVQTKIECFFAKVKTSRYLRTALFQAPILPLMRRHGNRSQSGVRVVSGNFTSAKMRGICDGVDFGFTGDVKSFSFCIERMRFRCVLSQDHRFKTF